MIFLSFIIPYHNESAAMLSACIGSILALPLSPDEREVLVIDDGSEVPFEALLPDLRHEVRCFRQPNRGLSAARNRGIELSQGTYLQFVDADDALIPDAYEHVIRSVRTREIDLLLFRFTTTYSRYVKAEGAPSRPMPGSQYLLRHNLRAAACCYLFRRDLLGPLRFKEGIYHEDSLFSPQLMLQARAMADCTIEAYYYRQHEGTIMNRRDPQHIQKRLADSFSVLEELTRIQPTLSEEARPAMKRVIDQQTMCYLYFIVVLTHSLSEWRRRVVPLRALGLYPLPLRCYTLKYWLFALLSKAVNL